MKILLISFEYFPPLKKKKSYESELYPGLEKRVAVRQDILKGTGNIL